MYLTPLHLPHALLSGRPTARAVLRGDGDLPHLRGEVLFFPFMEGSLVLARATGLPHDGFLAFHVHADGNCDCDGTGADAFLCAGGHYNPTGTDHPNHAGDLPPLLSNGGQAFSVVYTARFHPQEVVGRAVILHDKPDDFHSQPAGNAGGRIACGVIQAT